jgi:hypothetical protein
LVERSYDAFDYRNDFRQLYGRGRNRGLYIRSFFGANRNGESYAGCTDDYGGRPDYILYGRKRRADFFGSERKPLVERRYDAIHHGNDFGLLHGNDYVGGVYIAGFCSYGCNGEPDSGNADHLGRRLNDILLRQQRCADILVIDQ